MHTNSEYLNTPALIPPPASIQLAVTLWLVAIGAGLVQAVTRESTIASLISLATSRN